MPNENPNRENQGGSSGRPGQVKPNPSRYNNNTNSNQGEGNGKSFDAQDDSDRNVEIDTAGLDRDEVNLDRSGVGNSEGGQTNELSPDSDESENGDQGLQAGSGADYGSGAVRGTDRQQTGQQKQSGAANERSSNPLNRNQDDSKLQ